MRLLVLSACAAAIGRFGALTWVARSAAAPRRGPPEGHHLLENAARAEAPCLIAAALISERNYEVTNSPPPPPPRPPRERRMTELEKQADAIVHAVVAVELLDWHGKLGGTLENAFRKCVYTPVMPRLKRLTARELSEFDDFRVDPKTGRKQSRPSRIHDATLERQFTLGNIFTAEALAALSRIDHAAWFTRAELEGRREFMLSETPAHEDPAAKDLVAWGQAVVKTADGTEVAIASRPNGHCDATPNIWILPVFVDHDRTNHAERQTLLLILEHLEMDNIHEGVAGEVTGHARVYASHTPCISCLSSMCQYTRAFPGSHLKVTYDTWRQTRRWIGLDGPAEIPQIEEDE